MGEKYEVNTERQQILDKFKPSKILLPVLIGLGVVVYMFAREFQVESIENLSFTQYSVFWLLVSIILIALRDFGYIVRIKILSERDLTWRQCFQIIMLWEFTSAVTPSAIGGTGLAVIYLNKEGIPLGRSTAIVMATSFLDELYFIIMFPLVLLFLDMDALFYVPDGEYGVAWLTRNILYLSLVGYGLKFLWVLMITYGLFFNPRGVKYFLLKVFKLPILRRFRKQMGRVGTDMVSSSYRLRTRSLKFWVKAFSVTFISWTSRYWIVNTILLAFWAGTYTLKDHFIIFGRQLVMWIMMLVSPTPGGSGFAEFVFKEFLAEFIPGVGVAVGIALLWRLVTYYPYLLVGVFILPRWIKSKFSSKEE